MLPRVLIHVTKKSSSSLISECRGHRIFFLSPYPSLVECWPPALEDSVLQPAELRLIWRWDNRFVIVCQSNASKYLKVIWISVKCQTENVPPQCVPSATQEWLTSLPRICCPSPWNYSWVLGRKKCLRTVFSQVLGNTWVNATRALLSLLLAFSLDGCHQVPLSSDLNHLVAEIRALRGQLEQSIQVNNCLRLQLEQQLDGGTGKGSLSPSSMSQNFPANPDPGSKQSLFQGRKEKESRSPQPVGDTNMCAVKGVILLFLGSLGSSSQTGEALIWWPESMGFRVISVSRFSVCHYRLFALDDVFKQWSVEALVSSTWRW